MKSIPCHLPPNAPGHLRTRCSGRFWAYSGICAVILIAATVALQPVHALQIAVVKQEKLVYLQRVAPGDRFSTGYIHSVERSPVWEYFCIDPDYRIILRETTFKSSNVGLPYAAFGDEVFHSETDGFRITNMNRMISRLLIWADRSYKNRLQFRGEDLALYGFEGNTLVQVDVGAWRLGAYALEKAAIWMGTR
jgi:hypothetical protein